jgi:uncharacterized protein GlcG (DUF336 family)
MTHHHRRSSMKCTWPLHMHSPSSPAHRRTRWSSPNRVWRFGDGMPLRARDGRLIGARGISCGAVSQDVEVAQAGLAAFEAAIPD